MEAFSNSFLLVFASEMGDKTQLLALLLAVRYQRPWTVMSGILVATLLNHTLASYAGQKIANFFTPEHLAIILAVTFLIFAVWILVPDAEAKVSKTSRFGPFVTTTILFFFAEMGDKTQLATVALGAKYHSVLIVTVGSTLGMMASNILAVILGKKLLEKIPMKWIRWSASIIFAVFGLIILYSSYQM